jgi:N,N'-diacetylchitobiose transport system permease protein
MKKTLGLAVATTTADGLSRTQAFPPQGFNPASATRETDWGQVMAASTLVAIPVIVFFLIVQGRMSSGLLGGAGKG